MHVLFKAIPYSHDGLLELKDNDDLDQSVWTGIDIRCVLVIEDMLSCVLAQLYFVYTIVHD